MLIIGENIHIIAPQVKEAIAARDTAVIQRLAVEQVENGAGILDLNIGPQKKEGPEIMRWMVEAVQAVVDIPLSFDTTNLQAIRTGLSMAKHQGMVNSTSAQPQRLEEVPPVAAEYGAKLVALTMGQSGIPMTAEERVALAIEKLIPRALEVGIPMEDLYLDPLLMTVSGCQEYCPPAVEAVRYIKQGMDPAPMTTCGLSNVSNQVPADRRSLLNRVYLVMLMSVGLDTAIGDPLDKELMNVIRIVDQRDGSSAAGALLLTLHDRTAAMEELEPADVDMSEPDQVAVWRTYQVLMNKIIYTPDYLRG